MNRSPWIISAVPDALTHSSSPCLLRLSTTIEACGRAATFLAFRAEGEIHIAGRTKDLIIKAGRNLVPAEIEEATAGVPGIRRGCVAAFGVEQEGLGTESLVVVAETKAEDLAEQDRIVAAVVDAVAAAVGVPPDAVRLVPPGSVPKTSSGKIRRAASREVFESGLVGAPTHAVWMQFARLAMSAAAAKAAAWLALADRFSDSLDWSGYEEVRASAWQRQLHLFFHPSIDPTSSVGAIIISGSFNMISSILMRGYRTGESDNTFIPPAVFIMSWIKLPGPADISGSMLTRYITLFCLI